MNTDNRDQEIANIAKIAGIAKIENRFPLFSVPPRLRSEIAFFGDLGDSQIVRSVFIRGKVFRHLL
jgi:hypothetical protein